MPLTREQINQRITLAKQQGWDDARIRRSLQTTLAKGGGLAQSAPVQQKKSPGLIAQLAPILGSVGGAVVGGLATGGIGAFAGGAAGGAAGERYRQKASGEQADWGKVAKEGAFGALGNVGGAVKALRGAGALAKGAKAIKGVGLAEDALQATRAAGNTGKVENTLRGAARGIEQSTRQIRLPASVYGAGKEEAINATLDGLGFKGNAAAQYRKLAPAMSQVEARIGAVAKANPNVRVKVSDIKSAFFKNLDSQMRTGELDAPTAQKEVTKYIGDLMKKSGGKNGQLNLQELRDMKRLVNSDYDIIATKLEKGLPLTPTQKVAQVAWESMDGAVTKASPEIKALLTQQSHLYSAAPSLKAARVNPPTLRGLGSSLPVFATDALRYAGAETLKGAANVAGGAAGITAKAGPSIGNAARAGAGSMAGKALFGDDQAQGQEAPQEMDLFDQYSMPDEQMQPAAQQGSQYDPNTIVQMLQQDLAATGGKNFSKIQTMAKFMQEAAGGSGAGSELNTTQATQVSQFDNSLANLDEVESLVAQMGSAFGPIKGRVNSLNPYNPTQANINQATLVAAQNIGRALEGGKLTDADILRYQKALPSIIDTPQVAQDKINRLRKLITNQRQNYLQNSIGSTPDSSSLISGLNGLLSQ